MSNEGSWLEVATLTGSSSQATSPFIVKARKFRLKWSYKGNPQLSPTFYFFGFQLYPKGEAQLYVTAVQRGGHPDSEGVEEIEEGPGEFYVVVAAEKIQTWTIKVEELG